MERVRICRLHCSNGYRHVENKLHKLGLTTLPAEPSPNQEVVTWYAPQGVSENTRDALERLITAIHDLF